MENQFSNERIEGMIVTVRNVHVIIDRDLAKLYQVNISQMNRQIKRNMDRFPEDFMFQLTKAEYDGLKCHFGISNSRGGDRALPYAFTEQGVSMLSGILRSEIAIQINIRIIRAFVSMRRFIAANSSIFQRLEKVEYRQFESEYRINELFEKLENKTLQNSQGIFFDGQMFDAYVFIADLIRSASKSVVLIDNYIDETVLTMLDKREKEVEAVIYTKDINRKFSLDMKKHNEQYRPVEVRTFTKAHDRFLLIDEKVYHLGASLKDLGRKWFAFSLMTEWTAQDIIDRIQNYDNTAPQNRW